MNVRIELSTERVQELVEEAVRLQYRKLRDCVLACALTVHAKDPHDVDAGFKIRCVITGTLTTGESA